MSAIQGIVTPSSTCVASGGIAFSGSILRVGAKRLNVITVAMLNRDRGLKIHRNSPFPLKWVVAFGALTH